ncbi:hypothetical protein [Peribacillus kribbensis]|uniref:hypothetical protein n=1 Tax=Peribacillus kribbensis TaxID=356658 RepID=UPI0004037CDC|nr:hypothetical protein [Peribacillus kribbensis]
MTLREEALQNHWVIQRELGIQPKPPVRDAGDFSSAHSPWAAEVWKAIHHQPDAVYPYTIKGNTVAVNRHVEI